MHETITRFAPSPTGLLHLGHAYSALFAFEAARRAEGRFLLRIENIDSGRCRADFEDAIADDLAWLGLSWQTPVRRQSEHMDDYRAALDTLKAAGLLYPCFCTRAEIKREIESAAGAPHRVPTGPEGPVYPGTCRDLGAGDRDARIARGDAHAWRLDVEKAMNAAGPLSWTETGEGVHEATPQAFGDVVLARKDTPASYHLSCTVDDHIQGVTLVTRGADLKPSTHVHRLLQALLGLDVPEYRHHRMLSDESGRPFSKRDKDLAVRALREAGKTPADVMALAGWPER